MPLPATSGAYGHLGAECLEGLQGQEGQRSLRVYSRLPEEQLAESGYLHRSTGAGLRKARRSPAATSTFGGTPECEARIAIERALSDERLKNKLDADLVARCDEALQERLQALQLCVGAAGEREVLGSCWFLTSGWEDRAEKLFNLAGEVERKVGRQMNAELTPEPSLWGGIE